MPRTFRCPTCQAVIASTESEASVLTHCSSCGKRVKLSGNDKADLRRRVSADQDDDDNDNVAKPRKRRKKRRAAPKAALPPWALIAGGGTMLLLIIGVVIFARSGATPKDVPAVAGGPKGAAPAAQAQGPQGKGAVLPANKGVPQAANGPAGGVAEPAAPPEPAPPWTAKPDPGKPTEAPDVPADFGVHLGKSSGGVLFADAGGPFFLERGQPRVGASKGRANNKGRVNSKAGKPAAPQSQPGQATVAVIDLRTGKPGGTIAVAAPIDHSSRLSPDGQVLICPGPHLRHRAAGPGMTSRPPLEVWAAGAAEPTALLAVPGRLRWLGFSGQTGLVVQSADMTEQRLQVFDLTNGKQLKSFPLPRGAFPPLPPPSARPKWNSPENNYALTERAGAISGGGAMLALFGTRSVELFALAGGRRLGSLPVRTFAGKELHCSGLRFSENGKELAAIVSAHDKRGDSARLYVWNVADGSVLIDTKTDHLADGPPLPGPEPDTYVVALRNPGAGAATVDGQSVGNVVYPPGGVIDRATGVVLFGLGWRPELWASGGRIVGVGPIKHGPAEMPPSPASAAGAPVFRDKARTEQARRQRDAQTRENRYDLLAVYAGTINRTRYEAEKQFVRDATAPRPPAVAGDRGGLTATKPVAPAKWTALPGAAAAAPPPLRAVTAASLAAWCSTAIPGVPPSSRHATRPNHGTATR